jgi:hypothetical protein
MLQNRQICLRQNSKHPTGDFLTVCMVYCILFSVVFTPYLTGTSCGG